MKSRMRLRVVSVFYHIIETADFVVQKYSSAFVFSVLESMMKRCLVFVIYLDSLKRS